MIRGALILFFWGLAACARAPVGPDLAVILSDAPADRLSEYGLFKPTARAIPNQGVIAYDLINPLFSDHAEKQRYIYVPPGETVRYNAAEVFDFPVGSVLVKTFAFPADLRDPASEPDRIETRLLIRKETGWAAYPYVWTADRSDAHYRPVGDRQPVQFIARDGSETIFTYAVPNQNQCKTCHAVNGEIVPIGPKARNLNHNGPTGTNQLEDWQNLGLLVDLPDAPPSIYRVDDAMAPLDQRARAYLDINCAHCHREGGSASNSGLWLQVSETRPVRIGIGKYPTAAGRGAGHALHIISPGRPDDSILSYRMASTETGIAMPELGRALADDDGVALIRSWIESMEATPVSGQSSRP